MVIDYRALARELGIVVAIAIAANVSVALVFFTNNPDLVLADPKAWVISVAATTGRAVVVAVAAKLRSLLTPADA